MSSSIQTFVVCVPSAEAPSGDPTLLPAGPGAVYCPSGKVAVWRDGVMVPFTDQSSIDSVIGAGGASSSGFEFLNLTVDQGSMIGGAILGLWAMAWCFRQIARHLQTIDEDKFHD